MKSLKIPMSVDEFELAEFPFGWKDEYCDGFAYITPRHHGVLMKIPVKKRKIKTFVEIQPISAANSSESKLQFAPPAKRGVKHAKAWTLNGQAGFEELSELFYAAFVDSVEFCDYTKSEIKKRSARNIRMFFNEERGIPQLDLCRVAVLPDESERLVGACLISKYKYGFKNEILFVHPEFQAKGVGTALVSSVLNDLHKKGEKIFWSEHHICNEQSANWHRKFGFFEETDIITARLRRNYYRHQIWRNERLGNLASVEKLKPLLKQSEAEAERLGKIEEEDYGAAWLNWKYDY